MDSTPAGVQKREKVKKKIEKKFDPVKIEYFQQKVYFWFVEIFGGPKKCVDAAAQYLQKQRWI